MQKTKKYIIGNRKDKGRSDDFGKSYRKSYRDYFRR